MKGANGVWLAIIGVVVLCFWLSMIPLYKYPVSTDPFYSYLTSIIMAWLVAGPTLMAIGFAVAIVEKVRARK